MNEIFYVDLYFLFNFCIDLLALFLSSRALLIRIRAARLCLGALLGGAVAVLDAFLPQIALLRVFLALSTAPLCCMLTVGLRPVRQLFQETLFFLLTEFLLGGCVTSLSSLCGVALSEQKITPLVLLLLILSALTLFLCFFSSLRRNLERHICPVDICTNDCTLHAYALIDSGNLLRHPESGLAVALIGSAGAARMPNLLPPEQRTETIAVKTTVGSRVLSGGHITKAYILHKGKKRMLPEFLLVVDNDNKTYGGCEILLPTSLI